MIDGSIPCPGKGEAPEVATKGVKTSLRVAHYSQKTMSISQKCGS